jgi:hypothetical protein
MLIMPQSSESRGLPAFGGDAPDPLPTLIFLGDGCLMVFNFDNVSLPYYIFQNFNMAKG